MISAEEMIYRERILARTQRWANVQMPKLLRSVFGQRLGPLPLIGADSEKVAAVAAPATPIPEPLRSLPETGAMPKLRDTAMISAVKLFRPAVQVRDTQELVSAAVQRFCTLNYGCLPTTVAIHPLRLMALGETQLLTQGKSQLLVLDDACAELGCYTIRIAPNAQLPWDGVRCHKEDLLGCYWGVKTDFYL